MNQKTLLELAKLVRYYILISTTEAGSGHPTSSLSATDLMTVLMFGGFLKADLNNPEYNNNDRLIFSKGHAAPLLYALYAVAGKINEKELLTLRKFGSKLEGHPAMSFPYTESATGSLGQGLSIGAGMAMNAKLEKLNYKTYVLLGDSEITEGSVWEAFAWSAYNKLDNLIAIVDINRLGQRGETMYGHNLAIYKKKIEAFGWKVFIVDGHNLLEIEKTFKQAEKIIGKPVAILAKTIKGKGIKFWENKEGWHGKTLAQDELKQALKDLGQINKKLKGNVIKPKIKTIINPQLSITNKLPITNYQYKIGDLVATRKAYGQTLVELFNKFPEMVVLDAETSNSTYAEFFKKVYPERFLEMFIAEQNMFSVALGLSRRGKKPFVSTFGAFWSRAYDQIRMAQYSKPNLVICGSHAGVSIGEDGPSQMALEDIAMMRSVLNSVVMYPADAVATKAIMKLLTKHVGMSYLRTTREALPVLYKNTEKFKIGGSKVLYKSTKDIITVIGAGITLHEAQKAYKELKAQKINIRVIDLYSVKPLDLITLKKAAQDTKQIIVVEDHHKEGGLYEAITGALINENVKIYSLAVNKMPKSGTPTQLLNYENISAKAIIKLIKKLI
ncbi:MAG TPA: transketolase [Candidatus Magasanikbacteria bacterium]|jgi:transketolase|nr:transketolase [Candidatus Magasanikbacteria bacterium]